MSVRSAVLVLAAAAVAGCGGPVAQGRAEFIAECKKSDNPKSCICIADQLKAEADPEVYEALMAVAARDNKAGEQMVEDLPLSKKLSIPGAMIRAAVSCEGKS